MASASEPLVVPQSLVRKIGDLRRERVAEVEDFVDFLNHRDRREEDRALSRAAMIASEPSLATVWNNPEDDVYDAI